ncbi:hypothetical protein HY990_00660 [Candidatus Micrarchaeota archaeon]|nr:hypothetical protein [Candidatus Micrarchaeota archaeon]
MGFFDWIFGNTKNEKTEGSKFESRETQESTRKGQKDQIMKKYIEAKNKLAEEEHKSVPDALKIDKLKREVQLWKNALSKIEK